MKKMHECPACDGSGLDGGVPSDWPGAWLCGWCNGKGELSEAELAEFEEAQEGG